MLAEKSPCKLPRFFPQWYLSRNHSKCTDDLRGPVDVENLDLSFVPRGRLKALARYATTAQIYNLRQLASYFPPIRPKSKNAHNGSVRYVIPDCEDSPYTFLDEHTGVQFIRRTESYEWISPI